MDSGDAPGDAVWGGEHGEVAALLLAEHVRAESGDEGRDAAAVGRLEASATVDDRCGDGEEMTRPGRRMGETGSRERGSRVGLTPKRSDHLCTRSDGVASGGDALDTRSWQFFSPAGREAGSQLRVASRPTVSGNDKRLGV